MNIQGLSSYSANMLAIMRRHNEEAQAQTQAMDSKPEKGVETKAAAADGENLPSMDIWRELGKMGNVRSMSIEVMQTVSYKLYDGGEISFAEHTTLSYTSGEGAQDALEQNGQDSEADEKSQEQESMGLGQLMREIARSAWLRTEADEEGNIDWIEEFQSRHEEHTASGEERVANVDKRILEILQRLQAAAQGGLNVTV